MSTTDPDPDPHPHPDRGDLPVIRFFEPVPELWDELVDGIVIYDSRPEYDRHWIKSDAYVHLKSWR